MLYMDVLRGEDSTGVAAITTTNKVELYKSVGGTSELFYEHNKLPRGRSLTHAPVTCYIGHNRFATQGKINTENAHPFEFDNLVGAHNGTVQMSSISSFVGYKDFDVDSRIIFSHLSHKKGVDEVWEKADGALALTWWDKETEQLRVIRNKERPLTFAYSKDNKHMFWASEAWMIRVAAARNGVELHPLFDAEPNRLYTFDQKDTKEVIHYERDLPPFVAKVVPYSNVYNNRYWDEWEKQNEEKLPLPKKPVVDRTKNVNLIITEFHDIVGKPAALGFLMSGEPVRVNVSVSEHKVAKNRMQAGERGFFIADRVYRSHLDKGFWCNWSDIKFIKLKPHVSVIKDQTGGFRIVTKDTKTGFAPWHNKSVFLTQAAYLDRVKVGCSCCLIVPEWGERNDIEWVDKDTFFCGECKDLDYVKDIISDAKAS